MARGDHIQWKSQCNGPSVRLSVPSAYSSGTHSLISLKPKYKTSSSSLIHIIRNTKLWMNISQSTYKMVHNFLLLIYIYNIYIARGMYHNSFYEKETLNSYLNYSNCLYRIHTSVKPHKILMWNNVSCSKHTFQPNNKQDWSNILVVFRFFHHISVVVPHGR